MGIRLGSHLGPNLVFSLGRPRSISTHWASAVDSGAAVLAKSGSGWDSKELRVLGFRV